MSSYKYKLFLDSRQDLLAAIHLVLAGEWKFTFALINELSCDLV